jgi:hypothetical protein
MPNFPKNTSSFRMKSPLLNKKKKKEKKKKELSYDEMVELTGANPATDTVIASTGDSYKIRNSINEMNRMRAGIPSGNRIKSDDFRHGNRRNFTDYTLRTFTKP